MSFVPLQGPASFAGTHPPRDSEVQFSGAIAGGGTRLIRLPIRGAIPVLTRAMRADEAHPSVGLLGGATMLALKLVAAGRIQLAETGDAWRVGPLLPDDEDGVRRLASARSHEGTDAEQAEAVIRELIDAVADAMTRTPTRAPERAPTRRPALGPPTDDDPGLPGDVGVSLRVEAPEEQLADGLVTLVLQVHDRDDASHVADAADLWREGGDGGFSGSSGFARRARLSTGTELRKAAQAWSPLDQLLRRQVPDEMVLEGGELADLLEHGVAALLAVGVDVFWPRGLQSELTPRARVERIRADADNPLMTGLFGPEAMFGFDWRLALGDDPLTDQEMAALAAATTPIIRLRDNWVVIDPVLARRARKRVGRQARLKPVQALRAALTGVLEVGGEEVQIHPGASLLRLRDRIVDAATVAPLPPPVGLKATLRDYQLRGLTWLAELTGAGLGACLADDMGLGKTITLIALHLHRRERGLAGGPTLVVCPTSLLGNWEAEVHRFAPGVAVRRFHGTSRDLSVIEGESAEGFVLTTYGTMRRDCAPGAEGALAAVGWDLVVADEAQHIKNATSATARHLRTIGSRGRVALTGTPVENDLTELWAILDWTNPGLLGSRAAFRKVWAAPIESGVDPAVARRFAQLVEPFLLRRRKSDPGIAPELPPKTETDQIVALTREQVVLYEALVRDSMERIEKADEETRRGLVLALLTGLKQICNHPAHYLRQAAGRLRGRSEKLELLDELLGTILAEGGSALVFTQYVAMARLLERHFAEAGIPTLFLHGGTPVRSREQMVASFQQGGFPVFLLSLRAGGTGLNLTRADHVIHVDRWWNPAVEDQATDRAHRIGQTKAVQVHRLVTAGTIEQKIGELLARKRSLAEAVLGAGDTALTELSNAELRDLVSLSPPAEGA
ncbi:MAG: DEAD/DEAH box helicase [Marmoricola sp.]